ncbi:MAG: VanZ family protein [Polyangiaceae bacterium]
MAVEFRSGLLRLVTLGYALGILVLGVIPMGPLPLPTTFVPQDKLMHAAVFSGFTVLVFWATPRRLRRAIGAAVIATAFGGLLELLQALVPYRSADWFDLLADAVGAAIAALLLGLVGRLRNRASDPRSPVDR